ncbi:hypothetical protein DDB_G0294394 [Dictyostelium discoideum AX4]|uniref:Uncharacterized protein n=1 Tax=Dictyostelium discoideum TaxID=44689 RepID=Q54AJ9_DICDI|nr:hypothetical protein DDB_G0294394 [Dictyostelium discoideum AX4]EAL60290.1 hypothetical protein DDB_G0294394 [Dictyostelium discoideum AX4]|eukprot:XP_628703.1 hypothetical protein DDB_G0294394 [Dictyostelium discoideum AX4]
MEVIRQYKVVDYSLDHEVTVDAPGSYLFKNTFKIIIYMSYCRSASLVYINA